MIEQKLEVRLTENSFKVELWKGDATRYFAYRPYNILHGVVLALVLDEASGEKLESMLYLKEGENWIATQSKTHRLLSKYKPDTIEAKAFELILKEAQKYAKDSPN